MNILILTNNIAGLLFFRKEVVKALVDVGYDIYISGPDKGEWLQQVEDLGGHVVTTPFNLRGMNPFADLKLMMAYCKLIRRLHPMAVLTYTIKPNIYGGMACRLCRVSQLANVTGLGDAIENGGWLQKLTIMLYKVGISKAKRVFFQNRTNKEIFDQLGIVKEHAILLPGSGVNLQHHILQPYPEDEGKIRFLFIGRMLKDKGVEEYLEAARRIKVKYPQTEFQTLVWRNKLGLYADVLHQMVSEGVIQHLGSTLDVRPYIAAVECTVMPSYHEGMSNVNLESAACGRPVITTDVPGCRETVEHGKTGLLAQVRNVDSLVAAMERFIQMPYKEKVLMGLAARRKVEQEFSRQKVVDAYMREINSLA